MTEMFNVVKGVPLPAINRSPKNGERRKWPVEKMDVGDWCFIPERTTKSVSAYLSRITKNLPGKYTTRPATAIKTANGWEPCEPTCTDAIEGTGVWRTE
jgi:hypothetical protein